MGNHSPFPLTCSTLGSSRTPETPCSSAGTGWIFFVNAAGGNVPEATLRDGVGFFELPEEALRQVMDLNFLGTVLPCQVFGAAMLEVLREPDGCIVNISSMAAYPDQRGRLLGRQGRRRQLHPLARRRARSPIRSGPQGQRHSARLL